MYQIATRPSRGPARNSNRPPTFPICHAGLTIRERRIPETYSTWKPSRTLFSPIPVSLGNFTNVSLTAAGNMKTNRLVTDSNFCELRSKVLRVGPVIIFSPDAITGGPGHQGRDCESTGGGSSWSGVSLDSIISRSASLLAWTRFPQVQGRDGTLRYRPAMRSWTFCGNGHVCVCGKCALSHEHVFEK